MFYFRDGEKWLDMTNIDIVIRELLPQVFFILQGDTQNVASKGIVPLCTSMKRFH